MIILNNISSFSGVEVYDTSMLNSFAFRLDFDVRQSLLSSLGNMVCGLR